MRQEFSKRTKLIAWNRAQGRCEICTAKLSAGQFDFHHKTECTFAGADSEDNIQLLCKTCHRKITSAQAPVIAKSNRQRAKHIGARTKSRRSFATNKDGPFKQKMDGTIVRRANAAPSNPAGRW